MKNTRGLRATIRYRRYLRDQCKSEEKSWRAKAPDATTVYLLPDGVASWYPENKSSVAASLFCTGVRAGCHSHSVLYEATLKRSLLSRVVLRRAAASINTVDHIAKPSNAARRQKPATKRVRAKKCSQSNNSSCTGEIYALIRTARVEDEERKFRRNERVFFGR